VQHWNGSEEAEVMICCLSRATLYCSPSRLMSSLGLPRVPGYPLGTWVVNYPGNFLLPDGYPGNRIFNLM